MTVLYIHPALGACIEAMIKMETSEVDLYELRGEFHNPDSILSQLTQGVEERSGGQLTVRLADPAFFKSHIKGRAVYTAVCPFDTPKGLVTELSEAMCLYILGPYENGFSREERASDEQVASYRALVEKSKRK